MAENPVFKVQELAVGISDGYLFLIGLENPCTPQTAVRLQIQDPSALENLKRLLGEAASNSPGS